MSRTVIVRGEHDNIVRLDGKPVTVGNQDGDVEVFDWSDENPALVAYNEGGFCSVSIELREVLAWCHKHRPDLIEATREELPEEPEKVTAAEAVRAELHELRAAFLAFVTTRSRATVAETLEEHDVVDAYREKYK